jgi:hypothetical protein
MKINNRASETARGLRIPGYGAKGLEPLTLLANRSLQLLGERSPGRPMTRVTVPYRFRPLLNGTMIFDRARGGYAGSLVV